MTHSMSRFAVLVVAIGVISFATLNAAPAPKVSIDELIEKLGDTDPKRFEWAQVQLQKLGEAALDKLDSAAEKHKVVPARARAKLVASRIRNGELLTVGDGAGYWFNRVAFSPDAKKAFVAGGALITFDLIEGRETARQMELQYARLGLTMSKDGLKFATGHQWDPIVRIGDVKSGEIKQELKGHKPGIDALAFSPSADRLVSGGLDSTLRLWDLKTGKELKSFPGITDQIRSVDFSADAKFILSGHCGAKSDFLVRLWDVENGKEVRQFKGHKEAVSGLFFLPDGKTAVSTSMDEFAIIWNLEDGKEVRRMTHKGGIYGAALSPDGKRLLTAGFGDQTVRLWDLESGKELKNFGVHGAAALGVAFSPDGQMALSTDARATIRLWRLPK